MRRSAVFSSLTIVLLLCLGSPPLHAFEKALPGGPVEIEADAIVYNGADDSFQATGTVLITFSGGYLKADSVIFTRPANLAHAVGNVELRNDDDILKGDEVFFNTASRTGTVKNGGMFVAENHIYIHGQLIEKKTEANYRLENGSFTTCDGSCPDWRITGKELDVVVDGYGTLKQGRFLVGDIPILYLPWLIFPVKTTRQTGFLFPRFSYSLDNNGLDVEVPFFWAVSESVDATFYQRYLEKRGFKEGMELRYFISPDSSGVFYGDFIRDRKRIAETAGASSRDWQDDRNRWSYYFNHEAVFANGLNIRADINRVSDHWYFRDFSTFNYYAENYSPAGNEQFKRVSFPGNESLGYLNSTVRAAKDWPLYNLTALVRYTDDFSSPDNDLTLQKYPEAVLTGFRRPLFDSMLQLEFAGGYDYFFSQEGQKGHLWELSPTLFLPVNLGKYLKMTSWTGFRGDAWDRSDSLTDAADKSGQRGVLAMGTILSTELSRVYDTGGQTLEKIRHIIKPEIAYTYATDYAEENIPDFLDRVSDYHNLRYGIVSSVVGRMRAKDGKVGYRELMRLKASQAYDIREARRDDAGGNRPFGAIDLELDLAPVQYLSLSTRNKFDVNSGAMLQNNYDLTLSDDRGDSLSAGYRYTRGILEEINLSVRARLSSALRAYYLIRQNQRDRQTVESTVGLRYQKQCWAVELTVSDRYNDRNVMVYFSLLGLGGAID
ncbi:MAG: LPS-assembly protein LptD [Syntrophales bacterium]